MVRIQPKFISLLFTSVCVELSIKSDFVCYAHFIMPSCCPGLQDVVVNRMPLVSCKGAGQSRPGMNASKNKLLDWKILTHLNPCPPVIGPQLSTPAIHPNCPPQPSTPTVHPNRPSQPSTSNVYPNHPPPSTPTVHHPLSTPHNPFKSSLSS